MPTPDSADLLDRIPDPDTVRVMLADAIRRRDLLRSLLRVSVRVASYPRPTPQHPSEPAPEVSRA